MKWQREAIEIDTDRHRLDMTTIAKWLSQSYWANDRAPDAVRRSWDAAHLVFGLYDGTQQIGCARVVTDYVAIAYLADVFVTETHRGCGLGRWLVETIVNHPHLTSVRWLLHTRDAHGLYRQLGFQAADERIMERPRPSASTGSRAPAAGTG